MIAFAAANLLLDLKSVWKWLCGRSVWQLLCMALAGYAALQHFQLADARHDRDAYKGQRDKAWADIKDANDRAAEANRQSKIITKQLEEARDEQDRRITADAKSLLLRGPGAARCAPPVPQGPGSANPANPNAPGPQVPSDDRAAVPWNWLVNRGKGHDELLNYVIKDLEWHRRMEETWKPK
jgi:hypothetical protein